MERKEEEKKPMIAHQHQEAGRGGKTRRDWLERREESQQKVELRRASVPRKQSISVPVQAGGEPWGTL